VSTHSRYDRKAVMQAVSSHPDGASPGRARGGGGDEATLAAAGRPGEPKDGGLICGDGRGIGGRGAGPSPQRRRYGSDPTARKGTLG
jgi:hypothetical protein